MLCIYTNPVTRIIRLLPYTCRMRDRERGNKINNLSGNLKRKSDFTLALAQKWQNLNAYLLIDTHAPHTCLNSLRKLSFSQA